MVFSGSTPKFSRLLGSVGSLLGFGDYHLRQIYQRAALLSLPFTPPLAHRPNIWWPQIGLARFANLPHGALSGPVQEDKAAVHRALIALVNETHETHERMELRKIDGLSGPAGEFFEHLEDWVANHPPCRRYRIISYQDFERVISLSLPRFLAGEPIGLFSADWISGRLFWAGEREREALACAVVYARRRGISVSLPAKVTRYRLSQAGFDSMQAQYHALWIPPSAWITASFMHLLLEKNMPYVRLFKLHEHYQEILLLPRHHPYSNALGLGLRKAGAFDAAEWLEPFVANQIPLTAH